MKKFVIIALCIFPLITLAQDTLVKWTFPNTPDDSIADGGIPANTGMAITVRGGTSAISYLSGATTYSAAASKWNNGNGTKYWQIKVVTLNYKTLKLSSRQKSSNTGPRDFKVQYKNGYTGTWTDIAGATVLDSNDWTHGVLTNVDLPSECNEQDTVYLRWIMTSNVSSNGSTVASDGTSRIDDIYITGIPTVDIIPPKVLEVYATSLSTINVQFNEAVNATAENITNYTGLISISSAVRNTSMDTITLTLATPLQTGIPDTLTISNIQDTSLNLMTTPQSFKVIFGTLPDTTHPTVMTAYATGLSQVKVIFSEPVDTTAEDTANYTGLGTISSAIRSVSMDTVTLTLSSPLIIYVQDTLTIANIFDTSGNSMQNPQQFKIMWGNLNNQNIVISEIMYNPPESGTDSLEFLELYNNGDSAVALKNFYFSTGITYKFHNDTIQPNSFYLIAADSVKFNNFFNKTAHKWTSGTLSNSGETIVIKDNFNIIVDSVYYKTSSQWPNAANGNGSSLMLCDYASDNSVAENWVASGPSNAALFGIVNTKQVYATPDTGCATLPPAVLNAFAKNLSDVKVVFNKAVDTTAENINNYTGLTSISSATRNTTLDTITLTLLTPLEAGATYTLTISDIKDTTGNVMVNPQSFEIFYNSTLAEIVITEIMYNDPSSGSDSLEFIELYNLGSTQANLSSYSFSSGIVYTFPANTIVDSNDYLVIAKNINAVNNFFGISGTLQWTSGSLNNTGEKIEIINMAGDVIDSLTYASTSPWPTKPNGNGPSLTLCNPNLDNSIGSNWKASEEFVDSLNHKAVYATPGTGCITTGIDENIMFENKVNCFPNPASDNLTLAIDGISNEIAIFDILGNLVYFNNRPASVNHINSENLNEGIYFIKVTFNNNTVITKKLSVM